MAPSHTQVTEHASQASASNSHLLDVTNGTTTLTTTVVVEHVQRSDIEVKIGSSQIIVLPDVISEMLNFIKIAPPLQRETNSSSMHASTEYQGSESTHVVVTDDVPNQVEACFEAIGSAGSPVLKKTNYQIVSSNMRLVLVDLGSIDSSGPLVSSKSVSALNETIVLINNCLGD